MDLEKFSFLWAKDSSWMLLPSGKSYLIAGYNENDQLISLQIEDDDLNEAVINKMRLEGVKVLTETEWQQIMIDVLPEEYKNPATKQKMVEQVLKIASEVTRKPPSP